MYHFRGRGNRTVGVVTVERHALADAWQLAADSRVRLLHLPTEQFEACQDIDHALALLLCDRDLVCAWLRKRHLQLFHARPLDVALRSAAGCFQLRRLLLAELAEADLSEGAAAMAVERP